jgi:hypothetical protein
MAVTARLRRLAYCLFAGVLAVDAGALASLAAHGTGVKRAVAGGVALAVALAAGMWRGRREAP